MVRIIVWRYDVAAQQCNSELNQAWPVGFGAVRNGANDGAGSFSHLIEHFRNAILPDDRKVLFPARLPGRIKNAKRARISRRGHQDSLPFSVRAQEIQNCDGAGLPHAAPFQAEIPVRTDLVQPFPDPLKGSAYPALHEAAGREGTPSVPVSSSSLPSSPPTVSLAQQRSQPYRQD